MHTVDEEAIGGSEKMESKTSVEQLPQPRPSFIELEGDAFICNPRLKADEADPTARNQLLAMTPE